MGSKQAYLFLLLLLVCPCSSQVPYPSFGGVDDINAPLIETASALNNQAGYYSVTVNGESELIRCPAGYFCPPNSSPSSPIPCGGNSFFCPLGSPRPTLVEKGHYTIGGDHLTRSDERICEPGFWCNNGTRTECDQGYYGSQFAETESKCSGLCEEGYFCPKGSTSPTQLPCGDPGMFCTVGAYETTQVALGYKSVGGSLTTRMGEVIVEEGYYAKEGIEYACPAGRYGDKKGLSDEACSGICREGFYCPPASTSPYQKMCGGSDRYCPEGSAAPVLVWEGHYTVNDFNGTCGAGRFRNFTNVVDDTISPVMKTSVTSTKVPVAPCDLCPAGKYKHVAGDDKALCLTCPYLTTGVELGGWGESTADRTSCLCYRVSGGKSFDNLYFNVTKGECHAIEVGQEVPHTDVVAGSDRTRSVQKECERGFYCVEGVRYKCPKGMYGEKIRETNSSCTGLCEAGYYCEEGNQNKRQFACGSSDLYCPTNSSTPTRVTEGYFTNEDAAEDVRSFETICPPGYWCTGGKRYKCIEGHYGAGTGNTASTCEGKCDPGHFCTEGSTSKTQNACGGSSVYCPKGSHNTTEVTPGYYTVPGAIDLEIRYGRDQKNATMSAQKVCEPGFYCSGGVKYHCAAGSWSNDWGMREQAECDRCEEGFYCPSHPLQPSTSATGLECGRVDLYCEAGSEKPKNVSLGYYTTPIGGRNTTRSGQAQCEKGYWCEAGIRRKCPAGVWGEKAGMTERKCSGFCPAGYSCPEGSTAPIECGVNEYSTAGAWMCISCGADSLGKGEDGSKRCKDRRLCCEQ
mmetsp:Transcript_16910/g.31665  ORF Transcript_16910/g.31665 Transcript_16910/m.31665 type:complete len:797 (+) Transcript_16910:126-2516(+)